VYIKKAIKIWNECGEIPPSLLEWDDPIIRISLRKAN